MLWIYQAKNNEANAAYTGNGWQAIIPGVALLEKIVQRAEQAARFAPLFVRFMTLRRPTEVKLAMPL